MAIFLTLWSCLMFCIMVFMTSTNLLFEGSQISNHACYEECIEKRGSVGLGTMGGSRIWRGIGDRNTVILSLVGGYV